MKIVFNRVILLISLILILIFSLGLVSASDDSNDFIDMAFDDSLINDCDESLIDEELELNDLSQSDLESDELEVSMKSYEDDSSSSNQEMLASSEGNDFKEIQNLIDQANENDTITLSGTYSGDSKIVLNKSLMIVGETSGATLDGQFLTQIMDVSSPNVIIKNIRFINSYDMSLTIGSKNVTIDNCSFENSINGELGSALSCFGDNVKILNSRFLNNIANKSSCHHTDGPAIYLIANNATIDNCTFINNTGYNFETASSGGAIWLKGFNCSISNSIFINNSATSKFAWTLHSEEQTFLAEGYGGAIYWVGNNGRIENCSFIDCIAHTYGGALYFKAVNGFLINNTDFINNYAVGDAGAIYLGQNIFNLNIENSKFEENAALGLQGVISQFNAYGGAIFSGKFVENLSVSNSSFLNNYGNSSIYYKGSNLTLSNSIFDSTGPNIENDTLEKFLAAVKDSTLENCILNITDFKLYSSSGSLFEEIIYTNGSLNNNFWGVNIKSFDEFKDMKLIQSDDEYLAPDNWANLAIGGLGFLSEKGIYEYKFRFILNDNSDIELSMPDYELDLENNIQSNFNGSQIFIKGNFAIINYDFAENGIDILEVKNKYGKLLDSLCIICGAVFVEESGNDTADIQNAIDGAEDGSVIVLSEKNYTIDTIAINKNIAIYSQGLANISSLDSSKVLFNIASKEINPDLTKVEINGLNFIVSNGDVLVFATAINHTSEDLIDIPNILIANNNLIKSNDDVVSDSVTVLKLTSTRAILATTGNISLINNNLLEGVNPFSFEVSSILNGSDVSVINGSIISHNDSNGSDVPNKTMPRGKSLIASKDMTTTTVYGKDGKIGKYFTFRLTDSNYKALAGKKVIINFNGKNYYRTTDKNGYVKLQINLAKKGTYAIVACFLGDDNYNASFKSSKIKVNPVKAKLKVSNKKYKLSLKKKTLTAKFLSPKGKAVKGKKISFRINGKTYTAKTNSKGVATVKVILNKRKTYKFTAKFAGDNTFKAISVKRKVVVK